MKSFKHWLENKSPNQIINQNQLKTQSLVTNKPVGLPKKKSWNGKKQEIMSFWKGLTDTPLIVDPIPYLHKGSTFGEDGIRITGSPDYIYSVLSRLKDFLQLESEQMKLQLLFRESDKINPNRPNKRSYSFYIQLRQRGSSKKS